MDESLYGLLQCDCEVCNCIQPVDREKWFGNVGMCEDCLDGIHDEEETTIAQTL